MRKVNLLHRYQFSGYLMLLFTGFCLQQATGSCLHSFRLVTFMHPSIPAVPTPLGLIPGNFPLIFLWMANSRGWGWGHLSCQMSGNGELKVEGGNSKELEAYMTLAVETSVLSTGSH